MPNDLDSYLDSVHSTHLHASSGNLPLSKRSCLDGIKLLNKLSRDGQSGATTQALSKYSLQLYEELSKNTQQDFTQKLLWISSKVGDEFYYPVIHFSSGLTSLSAEFVSKGPFEDNHASFQDLPLEAEFKVATYRNWASDEADLKNLYQDMLENCSFVSSFLSIVETSTGFPITLVSPNYDNSKYRVALHFNGTQRLVTIDNQLPVLPHSPRRNLILKSSSSEDLFWPAIIEKAFLKIMGDGYNFTGSNMSIDTFILTGWIPEIITINNFKLPENFPKLWKLYKSGQILLGVGTGNLTKQLSTELNLISEHDYTIHSFDPVTGSLVLKNPWIKDNQADRRFITLTDFNYLKFLYINWKFDSLFLYSNKMSFIYGAYEIFHQHPQFTFKNIKNTVEEVWILLETHLPVRKDQVINLLIYETMGDKVLTPNQYKCVNPGDTGTKNRLKLAKLRLSPGKSYTCVVTSTNSNCTFSICIYNNIASKMPLAKTRNLCAWTHPTITGNWPKLGGNWSISTFIDNPQYLVTVSEPVDMLICLYTKSRSTLVNFHLFHCDSQDKGFKLRNFDKSKLLFNENYNEGYQYVKVSLQPGLYKLILSPYNLHSESAEGFSLVLNYSGSNLECVKVSKLSNNLGLFTNTYVKDWMGNNRFKMHFKVDNHNVKLSFHVKHFNNYPQAFEQASDYRPAIRGSVFDATTSKPVQINEIWNDSLYGVFIDVTIEQPGNYLLLVERLELGVGTCVVDVGSSHKIIL